MRKQYLQSMESDSNMEEYFTQAQLVVFFVILLLAVDSINPVKIFLHVFPSVAPWHVATVSILLIFYVFITEMKQLLYFSVKIFFNSILSIFFRHVEIIGTHNIPTSGPVIFTSNHANQFVDSVVLLSTCQRKISYLIAESSWRRRIVGDVAWAMGALPVKRSQDSAKRGSGTVFLHEVSHSDTTKENATHSLEFQVQGTNTFFVSEINCGDKIRLNGSAAELKVLRIDHSESMHIDGSSLPEKFCLSSSVTFDIMPKIDQTLVYELTLAKLASGGAIGIFPEGGSHDRTDLLPLKAGVAYIAYSALEKHGLTIPIVPVGLNYFRRHRFRGRVIVEFGRPTYADTTALPDYQKDGFERRRVCNELLSRIEDNMRGVIVSTPNYETLKLVHTVRKLYINRMMNSSEKLDMSRRFSEGYKKLLFLTNDNPPPEWLKLKDRVQKYQTELKELGLRDYQVPGLTSEQNENYFDFVQREMRLPYRIAEMMVLMFVAFIPALFLNLPVGLIARTYALHRKKIAKETSKVKVEAMDVMLSEKVLICIVLVPSLWMMYGLILFHFTNLDGPTIALVILSLPIFSYMGIVTAEAGMVGFKDLKPFLMRLLSNRDRYLALPSIRLKLQEDLRKFIREVGPLLGNVYTEKKLDWPEIQKTNRYLTTSLKKE